MGNVALRECCPPRAPPASSELQLLGGPAEPAPEGSLHLDVRQARAFAMVHVTVVAAARRDGPVRRVRVMHALPCDQGWTRQAFSRPACGDVRARPAQHCATDAAVVTWDVKPTEAAGAGAYRELFVTSCVVLTARRRLRWHPGAVTWEECDALSAARPRAVVLEDSDEAAAWLDDLAARLRGQLPPLAALAALSRWVGAAITYSVSDVTWAVSDVAATLRHRKGWCGHRQAVFSAVAERMGVPSRHAWGYYVQSTARGAGAPRRRLWDGTRDSSRHTWAEVLLPRVGWVEVEPASALGDPFDIPYRYVRTPQALQTSCVWHCCDRGVWTRDRMLAKDVVRWARRSLVDCDAS